MIHFLINLGVAIASALVFWFLWWAFIVPLGAPAIGPFHAAGLALFYTFGLAVFSVRLQQFAQAAEIERVSLRRLVFLAEIFALGAVAKFFMVYGP